MSTSTTTSSAATSATFTHPFLSASVLLNRTEQTINRALSQVIAVDDLESESSLAGAIFWRIKDLLNEGRDTMTELEQLYHISSSLQAWVTNARPDSPVRQVCQACLDSLVTVTRRKALVILNHPLSPEQIEDLSKTWGVNSDAIISLPPELKTLWANIPPEADDVQVCMHVQPIINWARSKDIGLLAGDMIIIGGELVATLAVIAGMDKDILPVCATTRRESVEKTMPDGSVQKTNVFRHVRFRQIPIPILTR